MELLFGLKLKYVKVPVSLIEHQMVWKYFQWGNSFGLQGFSAPLLCKNSFFVCGLHNIPTLSHIVFVYISE